MGAAQTVTVVPAWLNLDTINNMDTVSVPTNARSTPGDPPLGVQKVVRAVNGVNPATTGHAQIVDALWAWLKFHTSLR